MKVGKLVVLAVLVATSAGCYHANIDTGRTPSTVTVDKSWAHGWIYGLVPPSTLETAQKCPSGVAKVETQLSFANQLVNFLTLGIYTPMEIKVTCAAATSASATSIEVTSSKVDAIEDAAKLSQEVSEPVFVTYSR